MTAPGNPWSDPATQTEQVAPPGPPAYPEPPYWGAPYWGAPYWGAPYWGPP